MLNEIDKLIIVSKNARLFLDSEEYSRCLKRAEKLYFSGLGRSCLAFRGGCFLAYHRLGLASIGEPLFSWTLLRYIVWEALDIVGNPKMTIERLWRVMTKQSARK
jgi:hypothetical protein